MVLFCRSFRSRYLSGSSGRRYLGVSTVVMFHTRRGTILNVAIIPRLVIAVEIDIEEEVDAVALGFQGGKQLRRGEYVINIVVEHVQVIEDVGGLGKALGERWGHFLEHRHKGPVQGWGGEIAVILGEDWSKGGALLGDTTPKLYLGHFRLQPMIGPDLRIELREALHEVP